MLLILKKWKITNTQLIIIKFLFNLSIGIKSLKNLYRKTHKAKRIGKYQINTFILYHGLKHDLSYSIVLISKIIGLTTIINNISLSNFKYFEISLNNKKKIKIIPKKKRTSNKFLVCIFEIKLSFTKGIL